MTIATGSALRVAYKKEATWKTAPGASGAQYLRRVACTLGLAKQTYRSNEITLSYQKNDMRHGVRSVTGGIQGELSAGTWKDFFAAFCRKAFAQTTAITGLTITTSGTGPTYTVARSAGSWITDGVKVGEVWRLTAGAFNAANLNKNLFVLAETALNLTVIPLNGVAMVAEGPIATATLTMPGKKTFCAVSAQTDDSFAIEKWFSDISISELYLGCKLDTMTLTLPPTGMAGIDLGFLGGDITTAGSQYYSTPTGETTTGIEAAVNGVVQAQGSTIALLTGLTLNGKGNMSGEAVVGSNTFPDILEGEMEVEGSATVLLTDGTFRDYFINETEVALAAALAATPAAAADFLAFSLPRVKLTSITPNDGAKGIQLTCGFVALRNSAGGASTASEDTTLVVQDAQA